MVFLISFEAVESIVIKTKKNNKTNFAKRVCHFPVRLLLSAVDLLEVSQRHFNVWNLNFWGRLGRIVLLFPATWGRYKVINMSEEPAPYILKLRLATLKIGAGGIC